MLAIDYHALVSGAPDTVLLLDIEQDCLIDANTNAERMFGRGRDELLQANLASLCPPRQADGRPSSLVLGEQIRQALAGEPRVFEAAFAHSAGGSIDCEMRLMPLPLANRQLLHARLTDVTGRKRAEALRSGQNALLETIAKGAVLMESLAQLVRLIESQSPGVLCSVMLLDEDGRRIHAACGPSLPPAYLAALHGLEIGPQAGSCGTAMYRKEAVVVGDIRNDPLWANYLPIAEPHGLRACWAIPILQRDRVLGSFAMYYREVRSPGAEDFGLIDIAIHMAGIAIEHSRHEQELLRHREHLEELVAARTIELTRAKEQSEMANEELATALENLCMTQDELLRRDKLAALGALVAGIAHELNTPIGNSLVAATTISERTRQLRASVAGGLRRSELETYLDDAAQADDIVLRNLQRAAGLVSSFKQIAVDRASSQRRRFDLREFVAELILPLRVALKNTGFTVEQDIADGLVMDSYPGPLGEVLSTLFDNCVLHAFEGRPGGDIVIRAAPAAAASSEIALSMSDNGVGIPADNLGRIYDPFFTTRLGSGGSGLGLHIAHNIVTGVLGGRIDVSSGVGTGTTFTLVLPAVAPLVTPQ
ncbi:MAG TPA: ATP-binding protein [Janthinobacterium sp.]|nr:ATP-binding protein [Janthinobacterium sp.]